MRDGAPIRFLVLMLGGWTCLRVAMLAPGWRAGEPRDAGPPSLPAQDARSTMHSPDPVARMPATAGSRAAAAHQQPPPRRFSPTWSPALAAPAPRVVAGSASFPIVATPPFAPIVLSSAQAPFGPPPQVPDAARPTRRWTGSAWLLARRDGGPTLAPGGTLGGSQAGARLLFRLNGDARQPLVLSGRVYAPLRRTAGAEAALGLDWWPSAGLPVHLLIERRQRLGREGRSAFSAAVHGGGSADLGRGWRLDGYAQAGVVGTRSRDLFVDGAARVSHPVGPVEVGGAVWGAAQPDASRLDAGPHVTLLIRTRDATLRLSAEYRYRIAGGARPASGPALTLGVDF